MSKVETKPSKEQIIDAQSKFDIVPDKDKIEIVGDTVTVKLDKDTFVNYAKEVHGLSKKDVKAFMDCASSYTEKLIEVNKDFCIDTFKENNDVKKVVLQAPFGHSRDTVNFTTRKDVEYTNPKDGSTVTVTHTGVTFKMSTLKKSSAVKEAAKEIREAIYG